jgi:uncharacterized membrane protein YgdD (TMEM256/DUF423 family)
VTSLGDRALAVIGALAGLLGVALSAAAAHGGGGGSLEIAARFLLMHAPVLMLVAALVDRGFVGPLGRIGGWTMAAGLALFCGDLSMRALAGVPIAPMAAPSGGILLMIGWLAQAVGLCRRP